MQEGSERKGRSGGHRVAHLCFCVGKHSCSAAASHSEVSRVRPGSATSSIFAPLDRTWLAKMMSPPKQRSPPSVMRYAFVLGGAGGGRRRGHSDLREAHVAGTRTLWERKGEKERGRGGAGTRGRGERGRGEEEERGEGERGERGRGGSGDEGKKGQLSASHLPASHVAHGWSCGEKTQRECAA